MRVVVWSCGQLGVEVANALVALPEVDRATLVQAPWKTRAREDSALGRIRAGIREEGFWAFLRRVFETRLPRASSTPAHPTLRGDVDRHEVDDFHGEDSLALARDFAADLGVVAGTYILREKLFSIPRLGSINLHSGKAPQYRGSAPAFWELYNGETEVGITIHRVAKKLDAGDIFLQEVFPLDPSPPGDPLAYVVRYRDEVLRPNGVRMLAEAVSGIARGSLSPTPQDGRGARTYRMPDASAKRELVERVRARRRQH